MVKSMKSAGITTYKRAKFHANYAEKKGGKYLSLANSKSRARQMVHTYLAAF